MDPGRVNEVSRGVKIMLLIQIVFLGIGCIVEAVNLYYVIFKCGLSGGDLARNIIMHTANILMFGLLILYATIGWKKVGSIHYRGVLLMFLITVIADLTTLYHDISSVGVGILAVMGMMIVLLHQKIRDERDAELIYGGILILAIAFSALLIFDKVPIDGASFFNKLFRFSLVLIASCVALDYEGNFERINFKRKNLPRDDE